VRRTATGINQMKAHSKLGASSMYRWSACPGSVRLCEGIESRTSAYAEEGTRAHELAEEILRKGFLTDTSGISQEMLDAVQIYVDYCKGLIWSGEEKISEFEAKLSLDAIHPGLFGTADFIWYGEMTKMLEVVDYKHGAGIPVEIFEDGKPNSQLMYYGLGAMLKYASEEIHRVKITIVQPRCNHPAGPIRSHEFDAIEMIDFISELTDAAKRTEDINAPLNPGEHCRFCPAAAQKCPAIQSKAVALAKETFSSELSYNPEKLSETLDMLPVLEAWCKNVREFAYAEAQHGRTPPRYKLVEKRATRRWKFDDHTTAESLGNLEALWEKKLKSPAQIEKIVGKEEVRDLVISESSGLVLAHESDKRPEISQNAIAAFKDAPLEMI
jgi:hypothetical protein